MPDKRAVAGRNSRISWVFPVSHAQRLETSAVASAGWVTSSVRQPVAGLDLLRQVPQNPLWCAPSLAQHACRHVTCRHCRVGSWSLESMHACTHHMLCSESSAGRSIPMRTRYFTRPACSAKGVVARCPVPTVCILVLWAAVWCMVYALYTNRTSGCSNPQPGLTKCMQDGCMPGCCECHGLWLQSCCNNCQSSYVQVAYATSLHPCSLTQNASPTSLQVRE